MIMILKCDCDTIYSIMKNILLDGIENGLKSGFETDKTKRKY